VQVANGWSRGTSEVLVIRLHMVGRFEYGFVIKALENLWSKKNRGASLFYFILFYLLLFYYLLIFSLSLFSFFFLFSLLFFSSHHIFFFIFSFAPQNFLQHYTYIAFVKDDVMTPPHAWTMLVLKHKKEGEWLLK
jgi:cellulose synthase/poly-beta-1,6-N-acetylglucosamine synthase-like glycosyltransferase